MKPKVVLLGMAFSIALILAAVIGKWDAEEVKISNVSANDLGLKEIWHLVVAQTSVSEKAKIHQFEAMLSNTGEINEFSFHVVERTARQGYVYSKVTYDAVKQNLNLRRNRMDDWLQYDRQFLAHDFFERIIEWNVLNIVASEQSMVRLKLMNDTVVNYHIKDRQTIGIDGKGQHVITDVQLPVRGLWLSACERTALSVGLLSGCENHKDYMLNF